MFFQVNKIFLKINIFIFIITVFVIASPILEATEGVPQVREEDNQIPEPEPDPIPIPTPTPTPEPDPTPVPRPDPTPTPFAGAPMLRLVEPTLIKLDAGEVKKMNVAIRNASPFLARDILITPVVPADAPFSFNFASNMRAVELGANSTRNIDLEIIVDENAKPGSHEIELKYSFFNRNSEDYTGSDKIIVQIVNGAPAPNILLNNFKSNKAIIISGEQFSITGDVVSTNNQKVNNLQVFVSEFEEGIGLYNDSNVRYFNDILSEEASFKFNFDTTSKIKSGTYPIKFTVSFVDNDGKEFSNVFEYYINIQSQNQNDKRGSIEVKDITAPIDEINIDEIFELSLTLVNNGDNTVNKIKVSYELDTENSIVPKSTSIKQINSLEIGEEQTLSFLFVATSKVISQSYPIGFNIEYETGFLDDDDSKEKETFSVFSSATIVNPKKDEEEENKSIPKLILSRYESNPLIVQAGTEFDLTMVFKNTSSTESIKNVKAFLTVDEKTEEKGNVFSPVNASNTFFIENIPPQGESTHSLKLFAVPDADPKTYPIIVNFEYEDSKANPIESTELVGINVKQQTNLDIDNFVVEEYGFVGEPINIAFDFFNTGKVKLSNVKVELESSSDNVQTVGSSIYIGEFSSGDIEYYEGNFIINDVGNYEISAIVSFNDDTGNQLQESRSFVVNVQDMPFMEMEMDDMYMFEEEENKNKFLIPSLLIGAVVLVAVIVGFIIFRKKLNIFKLGKRKDEQ